MLKLQVASVREFCNSSTGSEPPAMRMVVDSSADESESEGKKKSFLRKKAKPTTDALPSPVPPRGMNLLLAMRRVEAKPVNPRVDLQWKLASGKDGGAVDPDPADGVPAEPNEPFGIPARVNPDKMQPRKPKASDKVAALPKAKAAPKANPKAAPKAKSAPKARAKAAPQAHGSPEEAECAYVPGSCFATTLLRIMPASGQRPARPGRPAQSGRAS